MKITEHITDNSTEYNVKDGEIELRQVVLNNGEKFIEAACNCEMISIQDERVKPLFIALHNFKNS